MMWRREKLYMSHLLIIAAWLVELTTNWLSKCSFDGKTA
jgi:hypothetical protein